VIKSPIYTGALIGRILDVLAFKGFMVFLPKYLENHYGIPQYQVQMYMAVFGVVGFAIGDHFLSDCSLLVSLSFRHAFGKLRDAQVQVGGQEGGALRRLLFALRRCHFQPQNLPWLPFGC
jgi:hypothetical protein